MLPRPRYFDEELWGAATWPVLSAAYEGDGDKLRTLLDEEPGRIQAQFAYYEPLHYAVRGGHADIVKLLLHRGAHPKAEGWGGRLGEDTPLVKAKDREREDIVQLLLRAAETMPAYVPPPERPHTPEQKLRFTLSRACAGDDRAEVERILAERPDLTTAIALYEAVHHGQLDLVRFLICTGADVNGHMPWACWFTPLMHCLRHAEPRWAIAELLLEHGFPIDSTNGLGMTALHIVILHGTRAAADWLLDRGADPNAIEPEFGSTPLGWAARWSRMDMADLLLKRGGNPALPDDDKWAQPRRWAAKTGNVEIARLLSTSPV